MAKKIQIPADVMDVLERSIITDRGLQLPDEQLERSLYTRVAKIIEAAGGKWSKKDKFHVFPSDPREILGIAIKTGAVDNKQQIFQEFFTPHAIAEMMCEGVAAGDLVLEPSAGVGNIATAAARLGAEVQCYEIQPQHADTLERAGFEVAAVDFLTLQPAEAYDYVLMNPPFTAGQFQLHVQHAMKFLNSLGTLRAIGPKGLGGNRTKAQQQFHKWLEKQPHEITPLPAGTFKSEGTNIDTVLLTIRK